MTHPGNRSGSARIARRSLLAFIAAASAAAVVAGLSATPTAAVVAAADRGAERPGAVLRLHPDNPHYFEFRGRPTVLVTSAEHYGAVLNPDFDYQRYLHTLARDKLNYTRIFTGNYAEYKDAFTSSGVKNTLGPAEGRLLAPWARSDVPGYANGGNKFDLSRWDPAYFARLRDFVAQASRRGIVVEVALFSVNYNETNWGLSPLKAANNINGVGNVAWNQTYNFTDPGLQAAQEAMSRKIVTELRDFDNVIFEIINEPTISRRVLASWQERIAAVIVETEAGLPPHRRHLIAQNIHPVVGGPQTPAQWTITDPNPAVSLFNFHYATPGVVRDNYGLNKAIGHDETGFTGPTDTPYRIQGWRFLLAGGALYNNLDFSFSVDSPEGQEPLPPQAIGGGSQELRNQLRVLKDFLERLDFINMVPDRSVIAGALPADIRAEALVRDGLEYAIYLDDGGVGNRGGGGNSPNVERQVPLTLSLPAGHYHAEWLNPTSGDVVQRENLHHDGGEVTFDSPTFRQDVALHITRQGPRPR